MYKHEVREGRRLEEKSSSPNTLYILDIASDNSVMSHDDFISYLRYLKANERGFIFEEWFNESDFIKPEYYHEIKKIFDLL